MDDKEENFDVLDEKLLDLLEDLLGGIPEDKPLDHASKIMFEVIASLVDDGEIGEIPSSDASEEEKNNWIESAIPKIKEKIEVVPDGNTNS